MTTSSSSTACAPNSDQSDETPRAERRHKPPLWAEIQPTVTALTGTVIFGAVWAFLLCKIPSHSTRRSDSNDYLDWRPEKDWALIPTVFRDAFNTTSLSWADALGCNFWKCAALLGLLSFQSAAFWSDDTEPTQDLFTSPLAEESRGHTEDSDDQDRATWGNVAPFGYISARSSNTPPNSQAVPTSRRPTQPVQAQRTRSNCEKCGRNFASVSSRNQHLRGACKAGGDTLKKFPCSSCGKKLSTDWYRKEHEEKHCRLRPDRNLYL
jgi:hypothetical protein